MISAISVYEAGIVVVSRVGPDGVQQMYELLSELQVAIVPFDQSAASTCINVYGQFGKGISPVGLNLGDCPVYALAQMHNAPVLSTSDEFVRAGLQPPTSG